jgi:hypothetical protein
MFVLFTTGCTLVKVSDQSVSDVLETILYVENNLSNTFMNGYQFYLPKGVKITDKKDYNLTIKDNSNYYYLYVDTIAYYYKTKNSFVENTSHFYSKKFNHNNKDGYIDIIDNGNYYFVVLMYNYSKIETYVLKNDFSSSFMNMCYILSTIKYNDSVISQYVGSVGTIFQEEKFNIFNSEAENDNFLKYEEEYGTYKQTIDISKDNDIIGVDDIVE